MLFPRIKKVPKGKRVVDAEGVTQKMAEALKGVTVDASDTVLSRGESVSTGALHQGVLAG